jgi:hypothetical protein
VFGHPFFELGGFMNAMTGSPISRRAFARGAAVVSAACMVPASALPVHGLTPEPPFEQSADAHSLSSESQAEAEARYQTILGIYGSRFSETQKAELHRLCFLAQGPVDHLRAYALENGAGPALYLKPLVEREKRPEAAAANRPTAQPAKKP